MASPLVLFQVLLPSEARARASITIWEGTEEWLLGGVVHFVHFPLVAKEPTGVGEALYQLATSLLARVGAFVTIHVLVPLAGSSKSIGLV